MAYATNDKGDVLELSDGQWKPVDKSRIAVNPQTKQTAVFDGKAWQTLGAAKDTGAAPEVGSRINEMAAPGFERFSQNYLDKPLAYAASGIAGLPGEAYLAAEKLLALPYMKPSEVDKLPHVIPTSGDIYKTFFQPPPEFEAPQPESAGGRIAQAALTGAAAVPMGGGGASIPMLIGGASSGALAQGAGEVTNNDPLTMLLAGTLPLFFGYGTAAGVGAASKLRAPFRAPSQEVIAGRILRQSAVNPNVESPPVPLRQEGFKPTVGQATGDPGLLQAERVLQTGAGTEGTPLNPSNVAGGYIDRKVQNAEAIKRAIAGQTDGGAAADVAPVVRTAVATQNQAATDLLARAQAEVRRGFTDAAGTPAPNQTIPQTAGTIIRDQLAAQRDNLATVRAREAGNTYSAVDASTAAVNLDPVHSIIADGLAKFENTGIGSAIETAQKALLLKSGTPKTQLSQLQAALGDIRDQAGALSRAGNNKAAFQVGRIADALEAQINDADLALQNANDSYAAASRPLDPYNKPDVGNAASVLKQTRYGEGYATGPETVPGVYFNSKPTAASDMQEFQRLLGRNPQAVQAMRRYAASSALDAATNPDGTLSVSKFQKWLTDHADAIAQSPEIQADVNALSQRFGMIDRAEGQAKLMQAPREVQAWVDSDPAHAVRAVTGAANQAQAAANVWRAVGMDRAAQNGLRASYVDAFNAATVGATGYKSEVARQFLLRTADMRKIWFTPEQHAIWNEIQSAMKMNDATANSVLRGGSDTMQKLVGKSFLNVIVGNWVKPVGQTLGGIGGYVAGKALPGVGEAAGEVAGPLIGLKTGGDLISKIYAMPKGQIIDLLNRAMQDPALARALMMKAGTPPKMVPKILSDYLEGAVRSVPALAYRYRDAAE